MHRTILSAGMVLLSACTAVCLEDDSVADEPPPDNALVEGAGKRVPLGAAVEPAESPAEEADEAGEAETGENGDANANETGSDWGAYGEAGAKGQTAPEGDAWQTMSPYVKQPQVSPPSKPGYVTNFFYDTPLREALTEMAIQAGKTIISDASVQGLVTVDLQDVPLERALDIVLAVGDYTWRQMDGYILVGSMDPESPAFSKLSESRTIQLNHVDAVAVQTLLPESLRKYATAHKDMNAVVLSAPREKLEQIEAILAPLDAAPRQLVLEARVVVMETVNTLDMGIQWTYPQVQAGTYSDNSLHGDSRPPMSPRWPWGVRIGYSPDEEFTNALLLTLNLMAGNDQATVVASPQVMALDGQEAQIKVTTEEYFEILTRGIYTQSELEQIEAGTILTVTPKIGADGGITLTMSNEVSDVVARGSGGLPVVTRREASSTVRVRDGGTVVIAGLMDNRTRYSAQKVPGVGAVPVLGNPFRNDATERTSRQVFVFLTPRLLDPDSPDAKHAFVEREAIPLVDEDAFREELKQSLQRLGEGV